MNRLTMPEFPLGRLLAGLMVAGLAALMAAGPFTPSSVRAEEPKQVVVVNVPTVNAQQQGPWTVGLTSPVTLSSNTSIGIDPAHNLVRLAASQPMQESSSLSIGTSDKSWSWDVAVPSGKRLTIEYVSGSFTKKIGSTGEQTAPPFRFTVTTTTNGQTVGHVLPVIGVHTIGGVISYFEVAQQVRLYADANTNVTVKLEHLFSPGYEYEGSMNLSGQLADQP